MRLLLLTHSFNSLTQRLFVELRERGHEVSVEFDINDAVTIDAVELYRPDLIIAPFLKRAIPRAIWRHHVCLVVHPGIPGDRGPSALDWAILNRESRWGVTVLQANAEMDAGDIWAHSTFPMRDASKASLYRHEVTGAAVEAVLLALERYASGDYRPCPPGAMPSGLHGRLRPPMRQPDRAIDWQRDDTATVLRRIHSADGFPGVRDRLFDRELYLYDAHPETVLRGRAGEVIATCGDAICRATVDGAVWIGHLRDPRAGHPFKLPATRLLAGEVQQLRCDIDELMLLPGMYHLNCAVRRDGELLDHVEAACRFRVYGDALRDRSLADSSRWSSVILPHRWETTGSPDDVVCP